MENKGYTHVFWDFNGTVIDDFVACYKSENDLFRKYGMPTLPTPEDYRRLFSFPVKDYYANMGFDFNVTPYEVIAEEWMEYYLIHEKETGLCKGITEALEYVNSKGLPQWILSASEKEMLNRQLSDLGVRSYFEGILGRDDVHAGSKEALGIEWRKAHPDARILFLGDTSHDAATARAMGADCVLLTTGHSTKERLEKEECILLADSAYDALLRLI